MGVCSFLAAKIVLPHKLAEIQSVIYGKLLTGWQLQYPLPIFKYQLKLLPELLRCHLIVIRGVNSVDVINRTNFSIDGRFHMRSRSVQAQNICPVQVTEVYIICSVRTITHNAHAVTMNGYTIDTPDNSGKIQIRNSFHPSFGIGRLSLFLCDTLYVAAASNKQRRWSCQTNTQKSLQTQTGLEGILFQFGRAKAAHQSTVFLFGGLCDQFHHNRFFYNKSAPN